MSTEKDTGLFRLELSNGEKYSCHHTPLTVTDLIDTVIRQVGVTGTVCVDCTQPLQKSVTAFILPASLLTHKFIEDWSVKKVSFFYGDPKTYVAITRIVTHPVLMACYSDDDRLHLHNPRMILQPLTGLNGKAVDDTYLQFVYYDDESKHGLSIMDTVELLNSTGFMHGTCTVADHASADNLSLAGFTDVDEATMHYVLQAYCHVKVECKGRTAFIGRLLKESKNQEKEA